MSSPSGTDDHRGRRGPTSELPSVLARVVAFVSIGVGGLAGGLIGYAFAQLGGFEGAGAGLVTVASAAVGAGGVAVVAVLTLRAFGEWETIRSEGTPGGPVGAGSQGRRDRRGPATGPIRSGDS